MRGKAATALAALCVVALGGSAEGAKDGGYATVVEGAYLGGGAFTGTVRTPARGKLNGRSIRRRCRTGRQVDSSTHDGTVPVSVRTTRKGRWSFTLPEEPGRTIKIFVVAKPLPGGAYCTAGILKIQEPAAPPGP
jgi:hypothetical protein